MEASAFDIAYPAIEMALLKRLGTPNLPGWEEQGLRAQMTRIYEGVTRRAVQIAFAESSFRGQAEGQE